MLMSVRLEEAIGVVRPAQSEMALDDVKALFGLAFKGVMGVRLYKVNDIPIAIQEDVSGQGENTKWRNVVRIPLMIDWCVKLIDDRKVIFQPTLGNMVYEAGTASSRLIATLRGVEPERATSLPQSVVGIPTSQGIVYCFADEVSISG